MELGNLLQYLTSRLHSEEIALAGSSFMRRVRRNTALRVGICSGQMVSFEWAKRVTKELLVKRMSRFFAVNQLLTGLWQRGCYVRLSRHW